MELKDVVPRRAVLKLSATGGEYHLRPINLADEIWLADRFGDSLQANLNEGNMRAVAAIVFHQMEEADKKDFSARDVSLMNEEGETQTIRLGGEKLLSAMVQGPVEKIEMYKALMVTLGISQPLIDAIDTGEKKSEPASNPEKPSGKKSSTSSRPSTDGRRNISKRGQGGK